MYYGERLNSYTHMAGAMLACAGAAALLSQDTVRTDSVRFASFSVYGATLCLCYLASTLYHSTKGRIKEFFRKLDYVSIYLVIAGTYTPFALVTLKDQTGWMLLGAVWALAFVGIVQELWVAKGARVTSLLIYFTMGWIALLGLDPLIEGLTADGFAWLLGGGLVYTFGIVFYLFDERFPYWHGIWHLFVLAGSATHYTAIFRFVA